MKFLLILLTFASLALAPGQADAQGRGSSVGKAPFLLEPPSRYSDPGFQDAQITQSGGMSLAQAIESVRRRTNGKIVGAETRVSGGREVHYIKVLKDGRVKTHKVNGRRL